MSSFQPKPGDRVHVTVVATVDVAGQYRGVDNLGRLAFVLPPSGPTIVRVEPVPVPLPTGWGARIMATVTCSCGDPGSGVPVPGVLLVGVEQGRGGPVFHARDGLPCGCSTVIPLESTGLDALDDVEILDAGEPA